MKALALPALDDVIEAAFLGYSRARSANFTFQFLVFNALSSALPGQEKKQTLDAELIAQIRSEMLKLLKEDTHNIRMGVYPAAFSRLNVRWSICFVFLDCCSTVFRFTGESFSVRRPNLESSGREFLDELPKYYRRNFHFQTDGYLSRSISRTIRTSGGTTFWWISRCDETAGDWGAS